MHETKMWSYVNSFQQNMLISISNVYIIFPLSYASIALFVNSTVSLLLSRKICYIMRFIIIIATWIFNLIMYQKYT